MKENTQNESKCQEATRGDKQYVAIDELNADIVVIGVYDEYNEANERVKEAMRAEFLAVDEPYREVYERYESGEGVTVYFVDDARISNYQIHTVSQ